MNHLKAEEIFRIIDGTIENGERTRTMAHVESCPLCRREVELGRTIERAARSAPMARPSRDFTTRVMRTVVPTQKKTIGSWFINNLANVIAMALVLSIVWYAMSMKGSTGVSSGPSMISNALTVYSDYYGKVREALTPKEAKAIQKPLVTQYAELNKILLFTLVSVVILVAVDKLVGKRVARLRR